MLLRDSSVATGHRRRLATAERRIQEVCADASTTAELVDGLREPFDDALGLSGMLLSATDPDSTVLSTAAVIENLPESMCAPWMHNEFLEDDVNKFAELHRTGSPATTLDRATQGCPDLSPRHRHLNRPQGFGPELRTTFSAGGSCWGVAHFLRSHGEADFDDEALHWVDRLRDQVAVALQHPLGVPWQGDDEDWVPGVVTLDPDGHVVSMTPHADRLLDECWAHPIPAGDTACLPGEAYMVATLTRARAAQRPHTRRPVTRLRGRSGRWLTLRGDYTLDRTGQLCGIVLLIQPSRPTEMMPLVVSAYGLTEREQEVLAELMHGHTSGQIATRLFISEHTVRDHLKSIRAKTGTSSRGELMSLLFHEHSAPHTQFRHV